MAATAAEARFRVDRPIAQLRGTRVVALDDTSTAVVMRVAARPWAGARFFTSQSAQPRAARDGVRPGVDLYAVDGSHTPLDHELSDATVVVMIATTDSGAEAAATIGEACYDRGVMTFGLILDAGGDVAGAVSALRPHARVLMSSKDEADVAEMLTALRA